MSTLIFDAARQGHLRGVIDVLQNEGLNALWMLAEKEEKIGSVMHDLHYPIHFACGSRNLEVVRLILDKDPKCIRQQSKEWHYTPLHVACYIGDLPLSTLLVERGASVNELSAFDTSPLMFACMSQHYDYRVVEMLLTRDCNTRLTSKFGDTAFHCASKYGDEKIKEKSIEALIKTNAFVDAKDNNGKYPHEYLSGFLRSVAKSYWTRQHFAVLYRDGAEPPDQVKLCVVGDKKAGKTTVAVAMGAEGDPSQRTAGIEVSKTNRPEVGNTVVFDVAGHWGHHHTHSLVMRGISTLFSNIVDASLSRKEIRMRVKYWLCFISAARPRKWSDFREFIRPFMVTVGSHGDPEESKEAKQIMLREVMKIIYEEFKEEFDFIGEAHVLDCREKHSKDMHSLMVDVGKARYMCLKMLPAVSKICKRISDEVLCEQRKKSKFYNKEEFRLIVEKQSDVFKGEGFQLLVDHLCESGEVVEVDDRLVIDVQWMCLYALGPVLAGKDSHEFPVSLQAESDGSASKDKIATVLRMFRELKKSPFVMDVDSAINIYLHLGVALKHPDKENVYVFPGLIQQERPANAWQVVQHTYTTYVGCRIQCRLKIQIITPASFPVIQCSAAKSDAMFVTKWWQGGMTVAKKKSPHQPQLELEALVEVTDKIQYIRSIDAIVRGPAHSQGDCLRFLETIMHMIMSVLEQKSPGTITEVRYLSHRHISKHLTRPDSYSEEEIWAAKEANSKVVSHDTGEDSLIDLLVVPTDHIILLPCEVRAELCKVLDEPENDQADCKMLGKALGIKHPRKTSEVLEKWSQDMNATVSRLVDVLKMLDRPATDALEVVVCHQQPVTESLLSSRHQPKPTQYFTATAAAADGGHVDSNLDDVLKEEHELQLAGDVAGVWTAVAYYLAPKLFSKKKIEEIRQKYPQDVSLQLRCMLDKWHSHFGRNATCEEMIKALCHAGHRRLASQVFGGTLVDLAVPVNVDDTLEDTHDQIDLLAVPADHITSLPYEVRAKLCKVLNNPLDGQGDGKMLGKALGIEHSREANEVLKEWSQDMNASVSCLVDVLKTLDPPATDALQVLGYTEESVTRLETQSTDRASRVLAAACKHGVARWFSLCLDMGFTPAQVESITHSKPDDVDKVRAVFEEKCKLVGREKAADALMEACQKAQIAGAVQREANATASSSHTAGEPTATAATTMDIKAPAYHVDDVIRCVCKHGCNRWFEIGIELQFEPSELRSITSNISTDKGKLLAVLKKKAAALRLEEAVDEILQACKRISPPIIGDIRRELEEHKD